VTNRTENISFRKPFVNEIESVSRYMNDMISSDIKRQNKINIFLGLLGTAFLGVAIIGSSARILFAVLAVLTYLFMFCGFYHKKALVLRLDAYKSGMFLVADGFCNKLYPHPSYPQYQRASFCPIGVNSSEERLFIVDSNQSNTVGMKLLLVKMSLPGSKKEIITLLTPQMLNK